MCRYAQYNYKSHYACFKCRKGFKRKHLTDITRNKLIESKPFNCPQCNELMANVGLDCEVPKKKEIKKWKVLENLFEMGITYHSCGCGGPGYIPKELDEFKSYLIKMKNTYLKHYKDCLNEKVLDEEQRIERTKKLTHWNLKIKEIENVLVKF